MVEITELRKCAHLARTCNIVDPVRLAQIAEACDAYADILERPKEVTNSVVCAVLRKYEVNDFDTDDVEAMRAALQSVWPVQPNPRNQRPA